MILNKKGQVSLEILIVLSILIIGAVFVGVFFLSSVTRDAEDAEELDSFVDGFIRDLEGDREETNGEGGLDDPDSCNLNNVSFDFDPEDDDGFTVGEPEIIDISVSDLDEDNCEHFEICYSLNEGDNVCEDISNEERSINFEITEYTRVSVYVKAKDKTNTQPIQSGTVDKVYFFEEPEECVITGNVLFNPEGGTFDDDQLIVALRHSEENSNCSDYEICYFLQNQDISNCEPALNTQPITINLSETEIIHAHVRARDTQTNDPIDGPTEVQEYNLLSCNIPQNGEIYYLEQLAYINTDDVTLAGNYTLMQDLDFENLSSYCDEANFYNQEYTYGEGWVPIGSLSNPFTGTFVGQGNIIENLQINSSQNNQGLFGVVQDAHITNLGLDSIDIAGYSFVGGLVGQNKDSEINNCFAKGNVQGSESVGGLVGVNEGEVVRSYFDGIVEGTSQYIGGLVGTNKYHINESYSNNTVSGSVSGIGGLVGNNEFEGVIENSYSTSDIFGDSEVGGLVGINHHNILNSYSVGFVGGNTNVGGLVGVLMGGVVNNSYWNTETSQQNVSDAGEGKTTEQMKTESTFTPEWNFNTIWTIDEDTTYPYLQQNTQDPFP